MKRAPGALTTLTTLAVLSLVPAAGRAAEPAVPSAGSILQQLKPPAAAAPSGSTGLAIEPGRKGAAADSAPFEIKQLQVSGNTRFDTGRLHGLVAEAEGRRMTLRELDALIQRITAHYRKAGYPLARAIIPVQTIRDGVVRIEVIEARYGQVLLDNNSRVSSSVLQAMLAPLQPGAVVSQAQLDRTLLLLSDIPGVTLGALLRPGEAVGSSDLALTAGAGRTVEGYASLDNSGDGYTGRARAGAGLSYFNALGLGDAASVNVLSSGDRLKYARLGYEQQLGGQGTRAGAAWSALSYQLGNAASDLQAHGTATVGSLWVTHPWVRSLGFTLRSELKLEHLGLRDQVDVSAIRNDRYLDKVSLSVSGEAQSARAGGLAEAWRLGVGSGHVAFDDTPARLADEATAHTQGRFTLWSLYYSHVQNLASGTVLAVVANAQYSAGNQDPSQKFSLGGPYAVRAYDVGQVQGDTGYTLTAELRQSLGGLDAGLARWQAVAFADTGHVQVNRRPWAAGSNGVTMSGVGLGLNWTGPAQWQARVSVATPMGAAPDGAAVAHGTHGWVGLSKGF